MEKTVMRLNDALYNHNVRSESAYVLSVSMGVAYYDAENPLSLAELLSCADKDMYKQKQSKQKQFLYDRQRQDPDQ